MTARYWVQNEHRRRFFESLDEALAYADRVFRATGIILGIQEVAR